MPYMPNGENLKGIFFARRPKDNKSFLDSEISLCYKHFVKATGLKIPGGGSVQVVFTAVEVK